MKRPSGQEAQVLKTAAEAIGSTLGRMAVKAGLAKPAPKPVAPVAKKRAPARKKAAPKKKAMSARKPRTKSKA